MKNSRIIIVIILLLFYPIFSFCQEYDAPTIHKNIQPRQKFGKPIIYQFPDEVNKLIDDYIRTSGNTNSFYNIELDSKDNGYTIILRNTNYKVLEDTTSLQGLLLSSCFRYCVIGKLEIPIYLRSDKELGFYNFVITGDELVITITRTAYQTFKILEYQFNN